MCDSAYISTLTLLTSKTRREQKLCKNVEKIFVRISIKLNLNNDNPLSSKIIILNIKDFRYILLFRLDISFFLRLAKQKFT